MAIDPNIAVEGVLGAITAVGGIYSACKRISANRKKKQEKYKQNILNEVKEEVKKVKEALEVKINKLEIELESQKDNFSKDLGYLKEAHSSEMKVVAMRIAELKQDLNNRHDILVNLLTRLIDSR